MNHRKLPLVVTGLCFVFGAVSACYSDLEDADEYSDLVKNTETRPPNSAPGSQGAPSTTPTANNTAVTPSATTPASSSAAPTASGGDGGGPAASSTPPVASSAPSAYTPTPGCEDVVGDIFAAPDKCAGSGCHGGSFPINLADPADMGARLIDAPGTFCIDADAKFIDTENPEASIIIDKLSADPACGGVTMPSAPGTITDAERACIVEWVTAVANGQLQLQ